MTMTDNKKSHGVHSWLDILMTPFKNNKNTDSPKISWKLKKQYTGQWSINHPDFTNKHSLTINKDLTVLLDGVPFPYTLISADQDHLKIRDKNGYLLTLHCQNNRPTTIYDEADKRTYVLVK